MALQWKGVEINYIDIRSNSHTLLHYKKYFLSV